MSEERLTLTVDENQDSVVYVQADPAVAYSGLLNTGIRFEASGLVAVAGVAMAGSVDVGSIIHVYSDPTAKWYSIYPQTGAEVDILEDRDVKFKAEQRRVVRGIVAERKRGQFVTSFEDELGDEGDDG